MIRVLLIGPLPPPMGGDTRHFATLAEDLAACEGFHLTVVNTSRGQHHSHPVRNLATVWRTLVALIRNLRRIDIVSYHASDRGMFMAGPLIVGVAKLAGKATVLRLFGGSFGDFYQAQTGIGRAITRKFILSADVILLQTQRAIQQLRGSGHGRLSWFSTYVKAAQRPPTHNAEPAPDARCARFVFLGHLWRTKGLETILESAPQLPESVSIDIYGPLDEYSAAQIDQRGCGRVRYRGFLSHGEVDARLWDYDCLVLPTFHPGEGYPGVIAEAFAHGLPVVSTRWLAIPEMVDASCGVLIEPGDTDGFVAALCALYADRERWLSLKRGAARRASEFDHSVWSRKFEQICEKLVKN